VLISDIIISEEDLPAGQGAALSGSSAGGDSPMSEGILPLLGKACENIDAAKLLLNEGFIDVAITRAYFAMFYCAQALLLEKGITGSSHKRVISAFGQYLVSTGEAPVSLHRSRYNASCQSRVAHAEQKVKSV
jgi:uncharacterized protein (UPF0332 family)